MKKISMVLIIVLLFGLMISASADNYTEHYIAECGMHIEIPSELIVLTRNMTADDPAVIQYGIDVNALQTLFNDNDIYFDAIDENATSEIVVSVMEADSSIDYSKTSNIVLNNIAESVLSDLEEEGLHIENHSVYKQKETKFIMIDGKVDPSEDEHYVREYYTSVNGIGINIAQHSYTGPLSDYQKAVITHVVDSATFDSISSGGTGESMNTADESSPQKSSDSSLMTIFYVLIGVAVLILLAYLFLRKGSQKNRGYDSSNIYKQPFDNASNTGVHPHSVPLSDNPTPERIPAHEDLVESKVIDAEVEPVGYILCPQCKERLKSDAVFCPFCGTKLSGPDFEDEYEPTIRAD